MLSSLILEPETEAIKLACDGKTFRNASCPQKTSLLLPFTAAEEPLIRTYLTDHKLTHISRLFGDGCSKENAVFCENPIAYTYDPMKDRSSSSSKNKLLDKFQTIVDRSKYDHYGRCQNIGGSCVKVYDNKMFYSGNDGRLRISYLHEEKTRLLSRASGDIVEVRDKKLDFSRIVSLSLGDDKSSHNKLVGARRLSFGASIFKIYEHEDRSEYVEKILSIPSNDSFASIDFMPNGELCSLDCQGNVAIWDLSNSSHGRRIYSKVESSMVKDSKLIWGWGKISPGLHPKSILLADRTNVFEIDTREAISKRRKLCILTDWEHIRSFEKYANSPFIYTVTDSKVYTSDLRQPKYPLSSMLHRLGNCTPVYGMARGRQNYMDWLLVYDKLGEMSISLMDWGHSRCGSWTSKSKLLNLSCSVPLKDPSKLCGFSNIGGWKNTVIKGRSMAGEWLDNCVEERCSLGFTGADIGFENSGGPTVYAVNALGDVFFKTIQMNSDPEEPISLYESDESKILGEWAKSVVKSSLLPDIVLKRDQLPVFIKTKCHNNGGWKKSYNKFVRNNKWGLPVSLQSRKWSEMRKFSKKEKAFPQIKKEHWPCHLVRLITDKFKNKQERLLHFDLIKKHMELSHADTKNFYLHNFSYNCRTTQSDHKFVQHIEKLNLSKYSEESTHKAKNRHSENIIKILTSESTNTKASLSSSDKANLNTEDKATKNQNIDDFWDDLGIKAPQEVSKTINSDIVNAFSNYLQDESD